MNRTAWGPASRPAHRYWCLTALLWGMGEASSHFRLHYAVLGRGHWTEQEVVRECKAGLPPILSFCRPSAGHDIGLSSVCNLFALLDRQGGGVLFSHRILVPLLGELGHSLMEAAGRWMHWPSTWLGADVGCVGTCFVHNVTTQGASHLAFCLLVAQPERAQCDSL
jgi:hypothetical protein